VPRVKRKDLEAKRRAGDGGAEVRDHEAGYGVLGRSRVSEHEQRRGRAMITAHDDKPRELHTIEGRTKGEGREQVDVGRRRQVVYAS
jgi:hypothetical protein